MFLQMNLFLFSWHSTCSTWSEADVRQRTLGCFVFALCACQSYFGRFELYAFSLPGIPSHHKSGLNWAKIRLRLWLGIVGLGSMHQCSIHLSWETHRARSVRRGRNNVERGESIYQLLHQDCNWISKSPFPFFMIYWYYVDWVEPLSGFKLHERETDLV